MRLQGRAAPRSLIDGGVVALLYFTGIAATSLAAGVATGALVAAMAIDIGAQLSAGGGFIPPWLAMVSGAALAMLAARPYGTRLVLPIKDS